jgi:hypothetical protein
LWAFCNGLGFLYILQWLFGFLQCVLGFLQILQCLFCFLQCFFGFLQILQWFFGFLQWFFGFLLWGWFSAVPWLVGLAVNCKTCQIHDNSTMCEKPIKNQRFRDPLQSAVEKHMLCSSPKDSAPVLMVQQAFRKRRLQTIPAARKSRPVWVHHVGCTGQCW